MAVHWHPCACAAHLTLAMVVIYRRWTKCNYQWVHSNPDIKRVGWHRQKIKVIFGGADQHWDMRLQCVNLQHVLAVKNKCLGGDVYILFLSLFFTRSGICVRAYTTPFFFSFFLFFLFCFPVQYMHQFRPGSTELWFVLTRCFCAFQKSTFKESSFHAPVLWKYPVPNCLSTHPIRLIY